MKKSSKTIAIATAFMLGTMLTGCEPKENEPQEVYGPPTDIVSSTTETTTEDNTKNTQTITDAPNIDIEPTTEVPVAIYGPPDDFE